MVQRDLEALGVAPEQAAQTVERAASHFEVYPENWPALTLFLRLSTQWRFRAQTPTGLDYPSVLALLDVYGCEDRPDIFDRLRIMEQAAVAEFQKRQ